MGSTSYGYFAINDLLYLSDCVRLYNGTCLMCHEVVEKLFKHVVDKEFPATAKNRDLLHSHSLVALIRTVGTVYDISVEDFTGVALLNDFYFNGRYPTDSPFIATKGDINKCVKCVNGVVGWFFKSVNLETLFNLYCEVTGIEDDIKRFEDTDDSRRLLLDLCGITKIQEL